MNLIKVDTKHIKESFATFLQDYQKSIKALSKEIGSKDIIMIPQKMVKLQSLINELSIEMNNLDDEFLTTSLKEII